MTTTITIRIPHSLLRQLDAEVKRLRMLDGREIGRAGVIRQAVGHYLGGGQ
jgi:metal-responsive CopG/Arc/MetJ family transcriptional regulator